MAPTFTVSRFTLVLHPAEAVVSPVGSASPSQCVRVVFDKAHPDYDMGDAVVPSLQGYVFRLTVRRHGCTGGSCDQRVYYSSGRHVPPQNYQVSPHTQSGLFTD